MNGMLLAVALNIVPWPKEVVEQFGCCTNEAVEYREDRSLPPEGYALEVRRDAVKVRSADAAGRFYAERTLAQLPKPYPCLRIADAPAFGWRGVHIDDCRHFFGKAIVKRTIDLMSEYKLNRLHWHLTDDQGWRLDVPGYPDLVKYGAVRSQSRFMGGYDGMRYGPFYYTEADVKEVLAYAAERQVTIIPEIELPGHVYAALAAYPEFACVPENLKSRDPRIEWGISKDVLCVGNDKAIRFMEDVLDYVCRLFPGEVVHIGGDECPSVRWKDCPKCRARMAAEGLADEHALQPWVTRHFVDFLAKRGKRAIGWDEYLAGDVPVSAIGMNWHVRPAKGSTSGLVPGVEAALRGHDIVMAPETWTYLDHGQGLDDDPFVGSSWVTLEKCYSFDPYMNAPEAARKHILGGQCCNWSEHTSCFAELDWKMWPRTAAIAEALWTGEGRPGYRDFRRRMTVRRRDLIRRHVNCAPVPEDYPEVFMMPIAEDYVRMARAAYGQPDYATAYYTNSVLGKGDFTTEALLSTCKVRLPWKKGAVRWFSAPKANNIRDIGGWNGLRMGRVYRGSEFDSSVLRGAPDPLNPDQSKYASYRDLEPGSMDVLRKTMGIRTDLDLRNPKFRTLLGGDVNHVIVPLAAYTNLARTAKQKALAARALRVFADPRNYPVYVHCAGGADRTGSILMLLEGLCGVNETDLCIDYELTTFGFGGYSRMRTDKPYYFASLVKSLRTDPGRDLRADIEQFVRGELGLTSDEIAAIRRSLVAPRADDPPVVFLGDSITSGWRSAGAKTWARHFAAGRMKAANLGVGGHRSDTTRGVIDGLEFASLNPKAIVLMTGTNNSGGRDMLVEPPLKTVQSIKDIIVTLRRRLPDAAIIWHPILPRAESAADPRRIRNDVVNDAVRLYLHRMKDDHVLTCDFGARLVDAKGTMSVETAKDFLHPGPRGYEIWAEALVPYLDYALGYTRELPKAGQPAPSAVRTGAHGAVNPKASGHFITDGYSANNPSNRTYRLQEKFEESRREPPREYDLVMLGDSITQRFETGRGKEEWQELASRCRALDLGFDGDHTENVLWNVRYGGFLDKLTARFISLMIGTNNLSENADQVAEGIEACVREIRAKRPEAKVILNAVLPRINKPELKEKYARINERIRKLADGKDVLWLDQRPVYLGPDVTPAKQAELLPDGVHPNAEGYVRWREALQAVMNGGGK